MTIAVEHRIRLAGRTGTSLLPCRILPRSPSVGQYEADHRTVEASGLQLSCRSVRYGTASFTSP